ncbi:hypothetical protein [Hyphomonas pacifica]|uniref:Uncharacterized protein n=1 Tax=Hyphomonas pacifica TaxID=1280941 RepID=A0A062TN24_9PROT|nr:hypothetical protein [Hyphomonas pacifica]KCZ45515.1 hypothetical protein HY2_06680 [Hyphomonas pacifica]RAN35687.1 hypothetical protein HY3_07650 [Hyphomonas pacifica]
MTPETIVSACVSAGAASIAGLAVILQPALPEPDIKAVDYFQEADYAIFDHDFALKGRSCEVGIQKKGICLADSPIEDHIVPGMILPSQMPATSAEFAIILEAPLKKTELQTVRFGHRLALLNPNTREVIDVMDLDAQSFAEAQDLNREKADIIDADDQTT